MKRLVILFSALAVAASLFAQERPQKDTEATPLPEDLQALHTASALAIYGYKNGSASALVEAAKIFASTPTQEMEVTAGSTPTQEIPAGIGFSNDPKQLIADAKELAGKDKQMQKYIKKVEKSLGEVTRGAIGGPTLTGSLISSYGTDRYRIKFAGGRRANVILEATNQISDLDLYIYDDNGNLICYDDSSSSEASLSFTPRRDSYFVITIVNCGILPNGYVVATN